VSRDDTADLACELTQSSFVGLGPLDVLTARELTVLTLVGQGLTLKQIAERLERSFKTIDNHRASIGKKLRQTDRVALSIIAARAGLVPGDESRTRVRAPNSN
jgi:DNA-binding NarL/FixJ family response regulator